MIDEAAGLLFAGDTLGGSIVDALRRLADAAPGDAVPDADGSMVAWADIRAAYDRLWTRWQTTVGPVRATEALAADLSLRHGLVPAMRRRAVADKCGVVVTGHTHAACLERGPRGSVLANSGAYGPDGLRDAIRVIPEMGLVERWAYGRMVESMRVTG